MKDDRDESERDADLVVHRRSGCICINAMSPFSGDVQALMKEWNYGGFKRISTRLAKAWGYMIVLCKDHGQELDILGDIDSATESGEIQ